MLFGGIFTVTASCSHNNNNNNNNNSNNNLICKAPECQKTSMSLVDRNIRAN